MPFQLPDKETLAGLSVDALRQLLDDGLDEFQTLGISADSSEEDIAKAEALKPQLDEVSAAWKQAQAAAVSRAERANALLEGLGELAVPNDPDPDSGDEGGEGDEPADPDAAAVTIETPEVVVPEVVPASASPSGRSTSPARRAAANQTPPVPAKKVSQAVTLTAAADVPGFSTGQTLDGLDQLTAAVINRMKGVAKSRVGQGPARHHYGVGYITLPSDPGLIQLADRSNDFLLPWKAGDERRLESEQGKGSLTAAGGWCAPSETLYDLCQYETVQGIIDLPEFQVTRGGINWTPGPDFSDIYEGCGFHQTEAQAIAGAAKECCIVDCPDFEEIRLEADGLCVKSPLLTEAAYPELTRRFIEGAMVAYAHKQNKFVIDEIAAGAGTALTIPGTPVSTMWSLNMLEMQATGMKDRYRMAFDSVVEVIAPFWLKAAIRADLGMRQMPEDVSDAKIARWFSDRGMRVQFVYDWQPLFVSGCNTVVPDNVDVLMYPAGSWARGRANVINVNAVYDSTGLESNVYTALFLEEGILAVQRCLHTCRVTIPLCASGRTAAADIAQCTVWIGDQDIATTGVAGSPGSFLPTGDIRPGDYNALVNASPAIVASPTTAWTTGQHIILGDGDHAYWDGNSWERGNKPA